MSSNQNPLYQQHTTPFQQNIRPPNYPSSIAEAVTMIRRTSQDQANGAPQSPAVRHSPSIPPKNQSGSNVPNAPLHYDYNYNTLAGTGVRAQGSSPSTSQPTVHYQQPAQPYSQPPPPSSSSSSPSSSSHQGPCYHQPTQPCTPNHQHLSPQAVPSRYVQGPGQRTTLVQGRNANAQNRAPGNPNANINPNLNANIDGRHPVSYGADPVHARRHSQDVPSSQGSHSVQPSSQPTPTDHNAPSSQPSPSSSSFQLVRVPMVPGSTPGAGSSAGPEQRYVQQRQQQQQPQQSQQLQALVRQYRQQWPLQQQQGMSHTAPPGGQAPPQGYAQPHSGHSQPPSAYPSGLADRLPQAREALQRRHTLPDATPVSAPTATARSQSSVGAQGVQQQHSSYPYLPSHPPASAPPAMMHSQQSSFGAQGVQQQQQQQSYPTSSAQASGSRSPVIQIPRLSQTSHPPTLTSAHPDAGDGSAQQRRHSYPIPNPSLPSASQSSTQQQPSAQPSNDSSRNLVTPSNFRTPHSMQQHVATQSLNQAHPSSPSSTHVMPLTTPANATSSSSAVAHSPPSELSDEPYKALMNRLRSHFGPMDEAYRNLWRSHVLEMKDLVTEVHRQGLERISEERERTAEVQKRVEDMKSMGAVVVNEMQARLTKISNELRGTREALASAKVECERRVEEGKGANEVVDILRTSVDTLSAEIDTLRKEKDVWMKEKEVWIEEKERVRAEGKYLEHLRSVNGFLSAELEKLRGSEGSREGLVSKMGETVEVLHKDLEVERKLRIEAEQRVKELEGQLSSMRLAQSAQPTASTSQSPYPMTQNGTIFIAPRSNHPTTPTSNSSSPAPLYSPEIENLSVHAFPEPKYRPIRTIVPRSPPRRRVRLVMEEEPEVSGTRKGGILASARKGAQLSPPTPPPERVFRREGDGQELESLPDQMDGGEERTHSVAESSQLPPSLSNVQTSSPTLSSSPNSQPSTPVQSSPTYTQPPTPTTSPAFVCPKRKRTNEADNSNHSSHHGSPLKRQRGEQEVIELKDEDDENEVMVLVTPERSPMEEGEIVDGNEDVKPEPREDGEDGKVGAGLGVEHMDLLYRRDRREGISCRVCYHIPGHVLTRFGPGVTWKQAVDHCVKEHKEYCREMERMDGQKVVEMKVALGIIGKGGKGGKSVVDVLRA
ncbi:hypothetical protein BDQ17DRAFT_979442 [Cyathus striatus]|nr:hypothetical protein BDQ17DRAFT_979442 [Cyathus striatus]